ncbi:aldo/keto reductase [Cohnella zeiphila]|uniref:Aldo/keto reductase n=1 Tax=Cohnella zeiphila TaxID=2761120 RepID=A0A7X0SRB2_9BACL|nr:aldo/keto reductase [Cohnella zeiphila]MBB6734713.1 aldo/keto reductase [Cohnella zeiphila]
MKRKRLGKTYISLSVLGMGCWAYGGGAYWGEQSQKDVNDVVHAALDQGINYFDTAEVYNDGESERSLGLALKGRRTQAVIGTKVSTSNTKSAALRKHCEESLRRLGTDYIDIYMLHWPINQKAIEHFTADQSLISSPPTVQEAFDTLMQLRREGKIRAVGISNHGLRQMEEARQTGADIAVNELPYNLISRAIEDGIMPYCVDNQIGVLGYMAMQQGILTGAHSTADSLSAPRAHSRHFHYTRGGDMSRHGEEGAEEEIFDLLRGMKEIAAEIHTDIPTLSLAWAMAGEGITSTLVGSRNVAQLMINVKAASEPLPRDVIERLNKLSEPVLAKLGTNPDYYENRNNSRIY